MQSGNTSETGDSCGGPDAKLHGLPNTNHKLELSFKNGGERAAFKVSQISSHNEFVGQYQNGITVDAGRAATIEINDLNVPDVSTGTIIKVTVTVTKANLGQGLAANFGETSVSTTMLFTVGGNFEDSEKPETDIEYVTGCNVLANDTMCNSAQWSMNFDVRDQDSGLSAVSVRGMGVEAIKYRVYYKHPNYEIGTKDTIVVQADVSCCINAVSLRAVDLAGIQSDTEYVQGGSAGSLSAMALYTIVTIGMLTRKIVA
jgi:hypothetical protein